MNLKTRIKRIEMGVCTSCGGELDDVEKKQCSKCRKIQNEKASLDRKFYLDNGICPYCRKEKIFNNERSCPECRAKRTNIAMASREKHRIEYNAKLRKSRAIQRKNRKELKICTRCGKRNVLDGHSYCEKCLIRQREYGRRKREINGITISRSERVSYGLCYFCGKPVDTGKRTCQLCANRVTRNLPEKRGGGDFWKNDNKFIFGE